LREEGLATFSQRWVTIHDWESLQRLAEFDPQYLHLEKKMAVADLGGSRFWGCSRYYGLAHAVCVGDGSMPPAAETLLHFFRKRASTW
jgi:hypothetical protein